MPLILSMICLGENVAPGPRGLAAQAALVATSQAQQSRDGRGRRREVDENVNPAVCRTRAKDQSISGFVLIRCRYH